jgi:hypothetical protein
MAQIHSYLVMNAKSELKCLTEEITLEELDETFNQIAFSIISEDDLFENNDELEINFNFENDEIIELEEINNNNLEIADFIDLSASLFNTDNNEFSQEEEEVSIIDHGDLDFDIEEMVNRFNIE